MARKKSAEIEDPDPLDAVDAEDGDEEAGGEGDSPEEEDNADSAPPQQELYTMRYRHGMRGPVSGFILASSKEKAEMVGRVFCAGIIGTQFISVDRAILADESILDTAAGRTMIRQLKQSA